MSITKNMRRIVLLLLITLSLLSCKEQVDKLKDALEVETDKKYEFAIPTDWQLDNLRGKVKTQMNMVNNADMLVPVKDIIVYDSLGGRISAENLFPLSDVDTVNFSRVGKESYTKYKNNLRSYDRYVVDGKTLYSTDQQWFSPNHYMAVKSQLTIIDYTEGISDSLGRIQSIDISHQSTNGKKIRDVVKMMFYDESGYIIGYRFGVDGDLKDYEVKNKKFDAMGNVIHQTIYDENGDVYQDIRSVYEYY